MYKARIEDQLRQEKAKEVWQGMRIMKGFKHLTDGQVEGNLFFNRFYKGLVCPSLDLTTLTHPTSVSPTTPSVIDPFTPSLVNPPRTLSQPLSFTSAQVKRAGEATWEQGPWPGKYQHYGAKELCRTTVWSSSALF